jgi:hypothetical protein
MITDTIYCFALVFRAYVRVCTRVCLFFPSFPVTLLPTAATGGGTAFLTHTLDPGSRTS